MVEFALVLPLLLAIVFLTIASGLIYVVRTTEHKVAYDAARHVAKVDHSKYTRCERMSEGDKSVAQAVVDFNYTDPDHKNALLTSMTSNATVTDVSTGPGIGNPSSPNWDYYCPQAVQVTVEYDINIPVWNTVAALYGVDGGSGHLHEIGTAARLVYEYEDIPCDQQGKPKDKGC